MSPHEWSKQMKNPYFRSPHYQETPGGQLELRVEKRIKNILNKILFWRKKNNA